jgi:F420H(2)-dependent quinone reductase
MVGPALEARDARVRSPKEATLWQEFAARNPGFDEYRNLTERPIPVVVLELTARHELSRRGTGATPPGGRNDRPPAFLGGSYRGHEGGQDGPQQPGESLRSVPR